MRVWVGFFFSIREWRILPIIRYMPGDLFFDWLFLRSHISWHNWRSVTQKTWYDTKSTSAVPALKPTTGDVTKVERV